MEKLKKAFVTKVYDGDTIQIASGKTVRILGIDSPEMNYEKKEEKEMFADEARNFAVNELKSEYVYLETDKKKYDKYNRLLAYIYTSDGYMFNLKALKKGYANIYISSDNNKYNDLMIKELENAIKNQKGIWHIYEKKYWNNSLPRVDISLTKQHINKHVVLDAKVASINKYKNITFINLEDDNRLTLVIYKNIIKNFPYKPSDYLKNKKIKVSGKITKYNNSYEIILKNPYQVKLR